MRIQTLRRTSQVAFLAITLTGILIGTTGIVYPYFFCYSCPWDVGNCPVGLMEHGFVDIQITFMVGLSLLLYLFGFLMLMGLLMGRAFCGWACPIGALQDISKKLKVSDRVRRKLKPKVNPKYKNLKYLILLAIPVMSYITRDLFYTNLCPVGGVTGTIPTLLFYSGGWTLGSSIMVKATSVILFSILILLVARGWCKYLCPIGAMLAPWNKVAGVSVRRDCNTCTNCNLCERKCPMDVKDIGKKPDTECILCGRCVDACKFSSLKLGPAPFSGKKAMAIWIVLMLVAVSMVGAGGILGGYGRANDINSLPCLGCLALDPSVDEAWLSAAGPQPEFILEPLATKPVLLHYRTDVCPGCDEMEPHIGILESLYGDQVEFIHINLDHATAEEDASYDIYDVAGTPDARFGVPMFTTVIVEMNGTEPEFVYITQYGSSSDQGESKRHDIEAVLQEAIVRHVPTDLPIGPVAPSDKTVLSELFVDQGCVNCYKSEHALEDLESTGITEFVSFVTDAPGISGTYAKYREDAYVDMLNVSVLGHPMTVLTGGPGWIMGAASEESARAEYLADIGSAQFAQANLSISGQMDRSSGTLYSNITVSNADAAAHALRLEAFIVERRSRWLNLQGEPIPNAFVDLASNETLSLGPGEAKTFGIAWNGTGSLRFADMRMGNTAIVVAVWDGRLLVTSSIIEPTEPDALFLKVDTGVMPSLPNGTATFSFTLNNYQATGAEIGVTADVPAKWTADLSISSIYIGPNSSATFTATLIGNGTSSADPAYEFTFKAIMASDPTIQASAKVEVVVKDDILPPTLHGAVAAPAHPRASEPILISASVADPSGIASVKLTYFSCTPQACSPYFTVDMNETSPGNYSATVYAIGLDHTDLHYRVIAEDTEGNEAISEMFDVELEPEAAEAATTSKPKWIGVVLLCGFAAAAIAVALRSREKQPKRIEIPETPEEKL